MGISEAITRVRRGASKGSLLDGALSYLGAQLKSAIIPAPLRSLAARVASLLGAEEPAPYDDAATRQLEVISLDRALVRAAGGSAQPAAASSPESGAVGNAVPGGGDVCPFTGLRADGSLAEAPVHADPVVQSPAAPEQSSAPKQAVPERAVPEQEARTQQETPEQSSAPEQAAPEQAAPEQAAREQAAGEQAAGEQAAREQAAREQAVPEREVRAQAVPEQEDQAPAAVQVSSAAFGAPDNASQTGAEESTPEAGASAKPKKPAAKRAANQVSAKPAGEKRKEKLAVADDVTNTSARSASRSATKQSGGKGQTSSRKKA
jgi:hypothetical protein